MTQAPAALFDRLLAIMARLREPGGCPWDREQTPASLKPFLIEEAYEVLDAIDAGESRALAEELGDLLFQVVFHARIAEERGEFAMRDVLAALVDKMVSRHPHVFGDAAVGTPGEALAQWETLKQREATAQGRHRSILDGVPRAMPALVRAQRTQSKAARVGFDWPDARAAWEKVREEIDEAGEALAAGDRDRIREELGDVLFSLVNAARLASIDAEDALHGATEKFRRRFTEMEAELSAQGKSVENVPQADLEQAWEAVKAAERRR
ncbi:MAG: nucleoside triphosphate pyrophosphohydrolase [Candidatus Rokubacteria bacterium]|nr:nucleoside triphosphate pyrophosphohydrolase [Candidatus Rokubacteria bacterium]